MDIVYVREVESVEIEKRYMTGGEENGFKLSVYEDEGCNREVEDIDFGPIKPGEEKERWYWIKNTGEVELPRVYVGMGVIGSEGWETRTENYLGGPLDVGEKSMMPFRLKVEEDVEPGDYLGNIPITVYDDEDFY